MRKTFHFSVPNKTPDRQMETIRHEIKKYLGRERRKPVPPGADFWDFDCRIGNTPEDATAVEVFNIKNRVNEIAAEKKDSFYLEILAKPGNKPVKKSS